MKKFSGAAITPSTENVYAVENHEISCVLTDIPSQYTGVLWTPAVTTTDEYTLEDGTISGTSQTSKLTISAAKLVSLKSNSATQTFTCKITVGTNNTPVTATQTITIYNPSEENWTIIFVCRMMACNAICVIICAFSYSSVETEYLSTFQWNIIMYMINIMVLVR